MNLRTLKLPILLLLLTPLLPSALEPKNSGVEVTISELDPSIFLVNENIDHGVNLLLLKDGKRGLLIDTGFPIAQEELKEFIESTGIERVTHIIHSHQHWDHVGGSSFLKDAEVLYENPTGQTIELPGNLQRVIVELTVHFWFGEHQITLFYRPGGHSNSDVIVWIESAEMIFAGDLLFPQTYPVVVREEGARVEQFLKINRWLAECFDDKTILIPSHGTPIDVKQMRDYLSQLTSSVVAIERCLEKGWSNEQIIESGVLKPYQSFSGAIPFITDEYWIETIRAEVTR